MPTKDIASGIDQFLPISANITSNSVNTGGSVDLANYGEGAVFALGIIARVDGDYLLELQESSDNGSSDPWTDLPAEKYIGTPAIFSGESYLQKFETKLGCFSTKRYVRPKVTATNVTSGCTLAAVVCAAKGELLPT